MHVTKGQCPDISVNHKNFEEINSTPLKTRILKMMILKDTRKTIKKCIRIQELI